MIDKQAFDIVIVGAGVAGAAMACALTSGVYPELANLRIALIEAKNIELSNTEKQSESDNQNAESFGKRISAITKANGDFFEKIGIWEKIKRHRISAFKKMLVWDELGSGEISFDASQVHAEQLGYIIENHVMLNELINKLHSENRVRLFSGIKVEAISQQYIEPSSNGSAENDINRASAKETFFSGYCLSLSNGQSISCDLLVAADGAGSPLRKMLNFPVRSWDYNHHAIVCNIETELPHNATAYQCFTEHGPLAYLPLTLSSDDSQKYCSIVWSVEPDFAKRMMALPKEEFADYLGHGLQHKLGRVLGISERAFFPLRQQHAIDYVTEGFVMIADAAHVIHPLAGQGLNLGLADVQKLCECLEAGVERSLPISDLTALNRYQRERKTYNLAMMATVEGLKRLYQPVPAPLHLLRNWGMNILDRQQFVKNQIIKYAMGLY